MRNSLNDLNNHLFEQLERLMDDEVCHDEASTTLELKKTDAIVGIAQQITDIGRTQIAAMKFASDWGLKSSDLPALLEVKKGVLDA